MTGPTLRTCRSRVDCANQKLVSQFVNYWRGEMVEVEPQRNGQRGRPRHMYRLKGGLFEIIKPYVDEAEAEMKKLEGNLSRLNEVSEALANNATS